MSTVVDEILAQLPADKLAEQLGTDPDTALDAARKALPALLGGLSSNVAAGGGDALGGALLKDHDGSLLDASDLLSAIDTEDGQKIVGHIFGDQQEQVVEKLGATSRAGSSIFTKLLPLLAPIVLAWLAKKVVGSFIGGGQQAATTAAPGAIPTATSAADQSGGLGGLLGGSQPSGQGGGGLGSLLGGLFGGGGQAAAPATQPATGGGLGSLLGGLFGGGREAAESAGVQVGEAAEGLGGLGDLGGLLGGEGGGLGGLLGGLLGGEVEKGKAELPDLGGLFDILGGGGSDPGVGAK
jgi:hypothetical protein